MHFQIQIRKGVALAIAVALLTLLMIFVEWAWVKSWSNNPWMYSPAIVSFIAWIALMIAQHRRRSDAVAATRIEAYGSTVVLMASAFFLIEITPIAAGNNDSGEVFGLIFIPAIFVLVQAIVSSRRLHHARTKRPS